jgi:8-oxo-dGTP diphosphatase
VTTGAPSEPSWPPEPLHVAVDVVLFTVAAGRLSVLLWRRPYPPFADRWALPGTFSRQDETLDESPRRALADKAGITGAHVEQLATYDQPARGDAPGRDPRGRVVSVAYLALLRPAAVPDTTGREVGWWPVRGAPEPLAFDHARILDDAVARLQAKTRYAGLAFELLPEEFTLPEVQAVYEGVLGEELDVRNFRRDLHAAGVIEETGGTRAEGPGRPARLYRRVPGRFAVDAGERRVAERIAGTGNDGS